MANPIYGVTQPNTVLPLQIDKKVRQVWVESVDGADTVYFTVDGSVPSIGQDGCFFLPQGSASSIAFGLDSAQQVTVKFFSASAVKVSVRY